MRNLIFIFLLLMTATAAFADERGRIGSSRIFNNDWIGDGKDRWRTGSYALSYISGPEWENSLPEGFGDLIEYRIRTEIIAPSNLVGPGNGTDRRYVGAVSFGAHTHFLRGGNEVSLGFDFVATGPQTGMGDFHTWAHNGIGEPTPGVLASQIGNGLHPTVIAEIGRELWLNGHETGPRFRPFIEMQAGVETFVRVGGDFTIGNLGLGDMRVRDVVTGQRTLAVKSKRDGGLSFVVGGDAAYVVSSAYLPSTLGYSVTTPRLRARAGLYYERKETGIFYGLTWLGKEFDAQPTAGQLVGSLALKIKF